MNKMTTLTIGDKTWQVCDPEAARIDDTKVGDAAWSSQKVVEMLCPEHTARGQTAVFFPVAGYSLAVVNQLRPVQTGTPSPQTPAPISGHRTVVLTLNGAAQTLELGQTVYCGSLDWQTGALTLTHKMLTLTGQESGWRASGTDVYTTGLISDHIGEVQSITGICSHAPQNKNNAALVDSDYLTHANASVGGLSFNKLVTCWGLPECSVAAWQTFLSRQYESGTPVQVLYKLKTPLAYRLTPQTVTALAGENTLSCDTGDCAVTYRADPRKLLENLA